MLDFTAFWGRRSAIEMLPHLWKQPDVDDENLYHDELSSFVLLVFLDFDKFSDKKNIKVTLLNNF